MILKKIILISFSILTLNQDSFNAKVIGISDGDTIIVLTPDKQQIRIRLEGIDCPESNQDFGNRAKQATAELCFQKDVMIERTGVDQYGRTLAYVYVEKICVNKELIKLGMAWHYKQYNKDQELASLENEARAKRVGLWVQADPKAPWDFRHNK